jgi:very-short-patch-repair endonuclease
MVRLADVIQVRGGTSDQASWQGKINSKHLDFVLCDHGSLAPRLAIELDDASHDRPERQERDRFLDSGLAAAGLPLLRIRAAGKYDAKELRGSIDRLMGKPA